MGLGLILDARQIPVGMKVLPGNESDKPVIRETIDDLKKRNDILGKQLLQTEQTWVLLENDYQDVKDSNGNLLYRYKECIDDFSYTLTDRNGQKKTIRLIEKRIVTYNPQRAKKKRYEINKGVEKTKTLRAYQAKNLNMVIGRIMSPFF